MKKLLILVLPLLTLIGSNFLDAQGFFNHPRDFNRGDGNNYYNNDSEDNNEVPNIEHIYKEDTNGVINYTTTPPPAQQPAASQDKTK